MARKSAILSRQATPEILVIKVDVSAVSGVASTKAGLLEGTTKATIQKAGTGLYDITTVGLISRRKLVVLGGYSVTDGVTIAVPEATLTKETVRIRVLDESAALVDEDFTVTLMSFSTAQEL